MKLTEESFQLTYPVCESLAYGSVEAINAASTGFYQGSRAFQRELQAIINSSVSMKSQLWKVRSGLKAGAAYVCTEASMSDETPDGASIPESSQRQEGKKQTEVCAFLWLALKNVIWGLERWLSG